ncbi:protein tyrosine phosphatase [Gregarina niphandrodes]|uniref:Protein tyrosine phosphatase n=1 Tax=Gregarina niphandrodes TaxID=110365 RepID=A0A023B8R2_GRENI|nr:protein tyrosine phosphatase [Gregarina niphandrodes]EZG69650.1 protein tyrosine phosphatase [Gregarina niphandrodes]|eukprot:XP_011129990.1 protein tyrosine phosphatase [Gregarina niphandrodes]
MWSYDGAYFNASRIKFQLPDFACDMYEGNLYDGVVVGMQAPLPHTLDRFVKALIAEKVDIIVTLGGSAEGERRKMEPYWNGYKSSECTIEKVRELDAVVGVERHLRVTCHNLDGKLKRRAVIQLHYDDWLDHTTPDPKKFKALCRRRKNWHPHFCTPVPPDPES